MATFEHIHRFRDDRLKDYLERPKRGYRKLHPDRREDLLIANKHILNACNAEARIDFAHVTLEAFADYGVRQLGPHHFVTYTPADCVFPIGVASEFNIAVLKQRLRQTMPGIPFVGVVEAALFKEWGPNGPSPGRDYVSWHVHLVVWTTQKAKLEAALKPLKDRIPNMYDRPSIWIRRIEPDDLELMLLYILKGQIKEYRVNRELGETIDETTGEVRFRTRQQKRWMRTGDHVAMCEVLKHRWLVDLIFGNADGTHLTDAIRYNAMLPFCRWAERENAHAQRSHRAPYSQPLRNRALGQKLAREADEARALFPYARI